MTLLEKLKLFKEGMNDESCVLAGRFEQTIDEIIQTLERQEKLLAEAKDLVSSLSWRLEDEIKEGYVTSRERLDELNTWLAALEEEGKK